MTKLLDERGDLPAPVNLSPEEREAIAHSRAAAQRGEFATDEQVRAVWAKHGLDLHERGSDTA
jgi:hypothetical protein